MVTDGAAAARAALEALTCADPAAADGRSCTSMLGEVRRLRGWLDAIEARVTSRVAELHRAEGGPAAADAHVRAGSVSAAEARRRERRAAALDEAPSFSGALAEGSICAGHVDALADATCGLADPVREAVLEHEAELLSDAARLTPERFGRSVRDLARVLEHDDGLERDRRRRRDTYLTRRVDDATGMVEGRFSMHPELAGALFGAVDREVAAMLAEAERSGEADATGRRVDRRRLSAEALGRLVAAGHGARRSPVADITVIVDAETLRSGRLGATSTCETGSGRELPPASVQRLVCTGLVTPIVVGAGGAVLHAGRTVRHATAAQRRALRALHRTCAFLGCDVTFDRCELHHVEPWESGGATDLSNLVPICSRHHHVVHADGWRLHLAGDRTLTIDRPDGERHGTTRPDRRPERPPGRSSPPAADPPAADPPPGAPPSSRSSRRGAPPPANPPAGAPPPGAPPSGRSSPPGVDALRAPPPSRPAPPSPPSMRPPSTSPFGADPSCPASSTSGRPSTPTAPSRFDPDRPVTRAS